MTPKELPLSDPPILGAYPIGKRLVVSGEPAQIKDLPNRLRLSPFARSRAVINLGETAERRPIVFGDKSGANHFLTAFYGIGYAGPALKEPVVSLDLDQKTAEVQDGTPRRRLELLIIVESVCEAVLIVMGAAFLF